MSDELYWLPATELARQYREGSLSPVEVIDSVLDRLEQLEPTLNAFVTVTAESARKDAKRAETEQRSNPDLPPLHGIPVSVKDLTPTAGVRTTFGCKALADNVPTVDALAWARLKAAGAILIGKTTTPDFGMAGVTNSSLTGYTNNPWNPALTVGGSSGGAAASVASGIAPIAWGSDGGGSIRVPASVCGVVGLKCSPWRIPLLAEESSPFEHGAAVGPLTRTADDAALALAVTAGPTVREPLGPDPLDLSALKAAMDGPSLRGLRVAYSPDLGYGVVEAGVADRVRDAAGVFDRELGAHVEEVAIALPDPIEFFLAYWCPGMQGARETFLAEFGFDLGEVNPFIAPIIQAGEGVTAAEFLRTAHQTQAEIVNGFADVLDTFDLIICPTTPVAAFPDEEGAARRRSTVRTSDPGRTSSSTA